MCFPEHGSEKPSWKRWLCVTVFHPLMLRDQKFSSPQMAGALIPARGATPEGWLPLTCRDGARGRSFRRRCRPHSPSQPGIPYAAVHWIFATTSSKTTSQLLIIELQRDYYSLLKLDFSLWKQIFLIAGGGGGRWWNYIKICWKILVGTRHKNVPCSCRRLCCHS